MAKPQRIMEAANRDMSFLACFVRALTNHASKGKYRGRWHQEAATKCGHNHLTHILMECQAYQHSFMSLLQCLSVVREQKCSCQSTTSGVPDLRPSYLDFLTLVSGDRTKVFMSKYNPSGPDDATWPLSELLGFDILTLASSDRTKVFVPKYKTQAVQTMPLGLCPSCLGLTF
jgi:hypothetical protein